MYIYIKLNAPKYYNGTDAGSDFSSLVKPDMLHEEKVYNDLLTSKTKKMYKGINLKVQPNLASSIFMRYNIEYYVPVILFPQGSTILLEIYENEDKKNLLYQTEFYYELPKNIFPHPPPASTYEIMDDKFSKLLIDYKDVAKEKWDYYGGMTLMPLYSKDENVAFMLHIKMALNSDTKEPMTYYVDLIYALFACSICFEKDFLDKLLAKKDIAKSENKDQK